MSGFDMMEAFGLTQRVHSSVEGVAADPFAFNDLPIYSLYQDAQLRQSTRSVPLLCCCPRGTIVTPVSGVITKPLLQSLIQRPSASPCRYIHPAGFPAEHTISMGFRLLQSTPREPFALWQLTDSHFQPKMGVLLDRE